MQFSGFKFTAFLATEFVTNYFAPFSVAKADNYLLHKVLSSLE